MNKEKLIEYIKEAIKNIDNNHDLGQKEISFMKHIYIDLIISIEKKKLIRTRKDFNKKWKEIYDYKIDLDIDYDLLIFGSLFGYDEMKSLEATSLYIKEIIIDYLETVKNNE